MKKTALVLAGLLALAIFSAPEVRAGDNGSGSKPTADIPDRGHFSFSSQGIANFGDYNRPYSSSGVSLALMLHGKKRLKVPADIGLEWSNFGSSNRGRDFALNSLHLQAAIPFKFLYFKGGYGFSNLHDKTARESSTGGCWKWGFGVKMRFFVDELYVNFETNRWDGPGPVGFRAQSFGLEYHF